MLSLRDALRQLWRDLRSQKLRTFLTVFGIVWGTTAVTLLLAFGQGLHERLIKNTAGLGDRIAIAWPGLTSLPWEGLGRGRPVRLREEDILALAQATPGLRAISAEFPANLQAHVGDTTLAVDVSGVAPAFGPMRNLIPAPGGRFINPIDIAQRRRVVFLGDELATTLFGAQSPVGQTLMLGGSPFTVVGALVPKEQDSSYSGRDKDKAFVPSSTLRALTGAKYLNNFVYQAETPAGTSALTDAVRAGLAERLRFDPTDKEALSVWDTSEAFAFLDVFMLSFTAFLGIVGALTLVVGGIGVSNIMNVVVEERTREIGIKMALGARGGYVLRQLLLETLLVTAIGGALGLAIAYAVCALVPSFGVGEYIGTPTVSPWVATITTAILGSIGLLAGYFPARDAARLDPVAAMKL